MACLRQPNVGQHRVEPAVIARHFRYAVRDSSPPIRRGLRCVLLLPALGWLMSCAPRPVPQGANTRRHQHVHLPGEVRGARLAPVFARVVRVQMYDDGRWVVAPSAADSIGRVLATLRPTLVTGLLRFAPGEAPTPEHRRVLDIVRRLVRATEPAARFDLVLDAAAYPDGNEVVSHMRTLDDALLPDLWHFTRWDLADREHYAVVVSAIGQAHANGQAIGGVTASTEIPEDSDYGVLLQGAGTSLQRRLAAMSTLHPVPYLVIRADTLAMPPIGGRVRAFSLWPLATSEGDRGLSAAQVTAMLDRLK